jgi:hypothetical protein
MMLLLAALLLAQPAAAPDPAPPTEMIDFLGRRRLCLDLPASAERTAFAQSESRRLACASIASEERMWRDHYRGNAAALAWLDRDPRDFRVPGIMVSGYDGTPAPYVHRIALSGTDNGGQSPFHLSIDSDTENGGATIFTASWGDVPERSFRIDNARFPWLDLQSVRTAMTAQAPRGSFTVELRFGYRRGYCADRDEDDRPRLRIRFARDRVSAAYEDRTNCAVRNVDLTPG